MLELKHITKDYKVNSQTIHALNGVSMAFRKTEFVSIIGPSGCGKTTLLNVIGGLDIHTTGEIIIDGVSTNHFKPHDWDGYRNDSIGFVFQNYHLIPHLTVYENIEMSLVLSGVSKKERQQQIDHVLAKVGLLDQKKKLPKELSGGQAQRIAIARALVNQPRIILADEPTGALDSKTAHQIVGLLKEISQETLVIMVTHNETLAKTYSTRIVHLVDGVVIDDSHPFNSTPNQQTAITKKTSMSLLTSFYLSFKNLITKKFRTALTVFAGSVGIIGVTLVLIISNGVNVYMEDIQKATLSNYPITIRSVAQNDAPIIDEPEYTLYPNEALIYVTNRYSSYYGHVNIFSESFLSYLKQLNPSLYNVIDYRTGLDLKIISFMENTYKKVSTYRFTEVSDDLEYIASQYDVLAGKLPTERNEIAILVDRYNGIDVSVLNALGIDYKDISQYTFEEMMQKEYRIILNNDFYYLNASNNYAQYGSSSYETLYQNSEVELKISGIVRVSPTATTNLYDFGVLYSSKLTEFIIEDSLASEVVMAQMSYGLDKNVFTGLPFTDDETISAFVSKEYKYEAQLASLCAQAQINTIRIYTDTFSSRVIINDYLKAYNDDVTFEDQILYYDYMGNVTREFDAFIAILTNVLIAFASIALFVSSIMIAIITYVSVRERIKEIGILRSLGARRKDIARVFNAETTLIGLTSGILGITLGTLLIQPIIHIFIDVLAANNITTFDLTQLDITQFNPLYILYLLAGSIVLTLVAGFIPAIIAAMQSPVKAIKSE